MAAVLFSSILPLERVATLRCPPWQLPLSMDVGKLARSCCNALSVAISLLGAQHCTGGGATRFTRVMTPRRVHYAIVHVNRCGSHTNRSIARRHRDLHACHAIAMVKLRFHQARRRQRARPLTATKTGSLAVRSIFQTALLVGWKEARVAARQKTPTMYHNGTQCTLHIILNFHSYKRK